MATRTPASAADAFEPAIRASWRTFHQALNRVLRRGPSRGGVHELRIATRRLLAMEALVGPAGGRARSPAIAERMRPVFRAGGRLRDAQVCLEHLRMLEQRYTVAALVTAALRRRLPRLKDKLGSRLEALDEAALKHEVRLLTEAPSTLATARRRHQAAVRQLQRAAAVVSAEADPGELHALRIELKHVRYMGEWLAPFVDDPPAAERTRRLVAWQRLLGDIADQSALLEAIDRATGHEPTRAADFDALRAHVAQTQRRRIAALAHLLEHEGPLAGRARPARAGGTRGSRRAPPRIATRRAT